MSNLTAEQWARIQGQPKEPCLHPLAGGSRCAECPTCQPTPEEMLRVIERREASLDLLTDFDGALRRRGLDKQANHYAAKQRAVAAKAHRTPERRESA